MEREHDAGPGPGAALLGALAQVRPIEPPPSFFIAPLVEHAQGNHVFDVLVDGDGVFTAPASAPFALARYAAHAMLQGPAGHAPFGWTHCMTLAQAPLVIAPACREPARAVFVAAAYLAAHWACEGDGAVDLGFVPDRLDGEVTDALGEAPGVAAATAWHHPDTDRTATVLATSAATAHDAHRVKYTLACLDAAAADPPGQRLYLAAAAYLNAWWNTRGDPTDPLAEPRRLT